MAGVTAVAAQIAIPTPPVPFTLQVLAVILSGHLLGAIRGPRAGSLPARRGGRGAGLRRVFSGGPGVLLDPPGGYLISYPIAAAVAGLSSPAVAGAARRWAIFSGFLWGCASLAVIYALGAGWLAVVTKLPFGVILVQGVLIFVPFDLIKVSLATLVAVAVAPAIATPNTQRRGSSGWDR
jgi:biotin transport system substrate-specific component